MDFLVKFKKPLEVNEDDEFNEHNILKLQYDIIDKWKNSSETLFLTKGPPFLGIMGAVSGIFIHNHYRKKLKLRNYGRMTSYLPIVVLPAIVAPLLYRMVIQTEVFLSTYKCSVCLQVRSGLIQAGLATIYPGILAPLASFMYASRHYTYRLPSVTSQPLESFALYLKLTRPIRLPLVGIFLANYFAAMYITSCQIRDFHSIMMQVDQRADAIEARP